MSVRPKSKGRIKLKKLPLTEAAKFDVYDALSQKARIELELQEDKKILEQLSKLPIDFDPIHDVEKVHENTDWGVIDPGEFGGSDFDLDPVSVDNSSLNRDGFKEAEALMKKFRETTPPQKEVATDLLIKYTQGSASFDPKESWIQTYSGKRFTPLKPNPKAIVIQDVAHALAMQCRFSGHVKHFYSVAQHCVAVSYLCDSKDALWGLLHDATEAYLIDVPRPLKKSGKFGAYIEAEAVMQDAICERFGLPKEEPESVKRADKAMMATEARDLLVSLRTDWTQPMKPIPFTIQPLGPREAKLQYLQRFFELIGSPNDFDRYLEHEFHGSI